jgi:hypothetical protein
VFCSLEEVKAALEGLDQELDRQRGALRTTKTADQIIDRICRYCERISGPEH